MGQVGGAYLRTGDGQDWESLEWQTGVARGDELPCERVDIIKVERRVKRLWVGALSEQGAEICRVARLDGQDGASYGEIFLWRSAGFTSGVQMSRLTLSAMNGAAPR